MANINPILKLTTPVLRGRIGKVGNPDPDNFWGTYQHRKYLGKTLRYRVPLYTYVVTNTPAQIAVRQKFADAVSAWYALTEESKAEYNKKARGRFTRGQTLFIHNYMKQT